MTIFSIKKLTESFSDCILAYGHFDSIHPGHIRYLKYAKEKGKCLVIALRGDLVVNGKNRFQFSQSERAESLDLLSIANHIICLEGDELYKLVENLKPKMLIFGKEFENTNDVNLIKAINVQKRINGEIFFHAGEINYASIDLLSGSENELIQRRRSQFLVAIKRQNINKTNLLSSLEKWKSSRLLVIGDTILDQYAACETLGVSAEAPVLVVRELAKKNYIGGASIVASHITALGAKCDFISVVGEDEAAKSVKENINLMNVETNLIVDPSRPTTFKKRYVVENQKLFRVSNLEDHTLNSDIEEKVISLIKEKSKSVQGIVVSDFLYGFVTPKIMETVYKMSSKYGLKLFGDLQCSTQVGSIKKYKKFSLLCPNEKEARIALQDKDSGLEILSNNLITQTMSERLIMKLGADGFIAYDRDQNGNLKSQSFPALSVNPVDVSGAGDSLLACMGCGLTSNQNMMTTSALGCFVTSLAVENMGNIPVTSNEVISKIESFLV